MRQYQTLILIALMVVAFYFLIMRPQRKRQQAIQRTMNELTPGTRVLLNSGIFGTVIAISDRQAKVELAPGVELTVLKQAIARVATDADEDTFTDEDDDDLEDAYDEPDAVEPAPVDPQPSRASRGRSSNGLPRTDPSPPLGTPTVATPTGHPGRTLIVLAVIVVGLISLMAVSGTGSRSWDSTCRAAPRSR